MLVHFPKDLSHRKAIYYMKKKYNSIFLCQKRQPNFLYCSRKKKFFLQFPFTPSLPSLELYSFGDGDGIATLSGSETLKYKEKNKVQRSFIAQPPTSLLFLSGDPLLSLASPLWVLASWLPTSSVSVLSDPSPQHCGVRCNNRWAKMSSR